MYTNLLHFEQSRSEEFLSKKLSRIQFLSNISYASQVIMTRLILDIYEEDMKNYLTTKKKLDKMPRLL